jgi:hypothetical protein
MSFLAYVCLYVLLNEATNDLGFDVDLSSRGGLNSVCVFHV